MIPKGGLRQAVTELVQEAHGLVQEGKSESAAFSTAYANASARDHRIGSAAGIVAGWLIDSTAETDKPGSASQALATLEGREEKNADLRSAVLTLIEGLEQSTITDSELLARTKKPWRKKPKGIRRDPNIHALDQIDLGDAETALRTSLERADVDFTNPDLRRVWEGFKDFARQAIVARDAQIQHETCFFEWGIYAWGADEQFEWAFTRQFSIADSDGDYLHMEHVHCTCSLEPTAELARLRSGDLWMGTSLDEWISEVEVQDAFKIPLRMRARALSVEQERV